jgi:hypothetical protein
VNISEALFSRLSGYVRSGGTVIWSLPQLSPDAEELAGVRVSEETFNSTQSRVIADDKVFSESAYESPYVQLSDARILLDNGEGSPLVLSRKVGEGEIVTVIVPFGLSQKIEEAHPVIGCDPDRDTDTVTFFDKPLGSPYRFLEGVKSVLLPRLEALSLIQADAFIDPPGMRDPRPAAISFGTSVTNDPNGYVAY